MIQRIQTIYLFLACAFAIVQLVLTVTIYHTRCLPPEDLTNVYRGLLAQTSICLAVAIFLFGNRKRQMKLVRCMMVECVLLSLAGVWMVYNNPYNCRILSSAIVLPVIVAAFSYLAWKAIRSDERKVRAADRIR